MKVLVTGSRSWTMHGPVRKRLAACPPGTIVVHGDARGADSVADILARELGFEVRSYPAEWDKYAKAAGQIRNAMMLKAEHPDKDGAYIDKCFAFTAIELEKSKGTHGMVKLVQKADPLIELTIVGSPWAT